MAKWAMTTNVYLAEIADTRHPLFWRVFGRVLPGFVVAVVLALFANASAQALTTPNQPSPTTQIHLPVIQGGTRTYTLVVGSEQDYPPFATGMTDATAGGFTVDLWKAVATEAGLNYTIRVRPFHQLLQEFKAGEIDVLINLAQSDERRQFADFTIPHVIVHGAIFVRKGQSDIRSEDDFAGRSIIVLNADLAHDYAVSKGWEKQLVLVDTAADGFRLLAAGRHDAMLLSKLAGMQTLQALALTNIEALRVKAGFSQKFAFATQHGQTELLAKLNEGLALTKSNGTYNSLYEKWFGIYEAKEVGLRDFLKYIIPLVVAFLLLVGYSFYRRQVERKLAQAAIAESRDLLMTIIDTAPVRVFWKDRNLRFLGCNTVFAKDAGMTHPNELIGKDDYQMGWAAQAELYRADDKAVMASGIAKLFYDEPQTTPSGQTIWLRTSKIPLRNRQKETIGLLGIYEDFTERKQAEEKLQLAATVFSHAREGIMITATDGTIIDLNDAFTDITGYSRDEALGKNPRILNSGRQNKEFYATMFRDLTKNGYWEAEIWNQRKNGEVFAVMQTISAVRDAKGNTQHYVSLFSDVSVRKQTEDKLRQLSIAVEQSPASVVITDLDACIQYVNPQFTELTGYSATEVIGQNPRILCSNLTAKEIYKELWGKLTRGLAWHGELINRRKNGEVYWEESHISPVKNPAGTVTHYVAVKTDITERKQLEDQVHQLAFYDALTKLPNRRLLNERLNQTMIVSKRNGRYGALMFLDLDNFKTLNDTHGHAAGDLLLIDVANRLKKCVREIDTVARFGGDEFVVMLSDLNEDKVKSTSQAGIIAEKICITLSEPYLLNIKANTTVEHQCAASIGVVVFINHEASQDDILKWADAAMYQAKEDGGNLVRFHR
jgi:diguanylate cyclase (GGDEF)-like protein/PAS domain S-box-containing protein